MIQEIKNDLLKEPESICDILSSFDFYHMRINNNRISFANSIDGNKNGISMKLDETLFTKDFVRNITGDVFSFIMKARHKNFKDVLDVIKDKLGIADFCVKKKVEVFNGLINKCKNKNFTLEYKTYPEDILNQYSIGYTTRFLNDYISFESQNKFDIMYDETANGIIIPIRSPVGNIMGIKMRKNYNVDSDESKYVYVLPCPVSQTLYGYSQNYDYLYGNDIIIGEAEKFVMQCDSYGYHNVVALGSSNLSKFQCTLLLSLNPKSISFMMDVGLDKDVLYRNMNLIKSYNKMINVPIYYWNESGFEDKMSPTDRGKDMFTKSLSDREEY